MNKDAKRGTGRTTRMLLHAIRMNRIESRVVYVVAANHSHAMTLLEMLIKLSPSPLQVISMEVNGIKIETPESLGVFDWTTMRSKGAHRNSVFLVDHFTIESRFSAMLAMMEAYDG